MPTPTKLREQSRLYREAAITATTPHLKKRLGDHALALAQQADKIEREEAKKIERDKGAF
jgi:hypothetical protein